MKYELKILNIILVVLIGLIVALSIVTFLVLGIASNSTNVTLEESEILLSDKNLGTYIEVFTGIVALLFPISLAIVSDAKGKYFNSHEVTSVVFSHWSYRSLSVILGFLIISTIFSFFNLIPAWGLILVFIGIISSLIVLYFYFNRLEKVIKDFSQLVREKEKENIEKLLSDG
tara:strand:- start:435 stop:953 length:519 start_codon:yes stop_codon:yes gene_type:complete